MAHLPEKLIPPVVFVDPPEDGTAFGGSRLLFREAARQFGVHVTTQEDYDWLVELGAGMLIDHLVDVEKEDIGPLFRDIANGNIRQDLNHDIQIRTINYLGRQTPEAMSTILRQVEEVNELAIAQRHATKPKEVVDIRIAEAEIFAAILALDESTEQDEVARRSFNTWLRGFSRTGYLVDTLFDVREDFESGGSGVRPGASALREYAFYATQESLNALKKTPPGLIGKCALAGFNYVMKQKRLSVARS